MGRHSESKEKEMKKQIFGYLTEGFDVPYIISMTGCDKNTAYKYRKEFDEIFYSHDVIDDEYLNKLQQKMNYKYDILYQKCDSLYRKIETEVDNCLKNKKPVQKHAYQTMRAIIADMSVIEGKKWNLLMHNPLIQNKEKDEKPNDR